MSSEFINNDEIATETIENIDRDEYLKELQPSINNISEKRVLRPRLNPLSIHPYTEHDWTKDAYKKTITSKRNKPKAKENMIDSEAGWITQDDEDFIEEFIDIDKQIGADDSDYDPENEEVDDEEILEPTDSSDNENGNIYIY